LLNKNKWFLIPTEKSVPKIWLRVIFKSGFKVENQIFGEDHFSVAVFFVSFFQKIRKPAWQGTKED
jgi:hypothetical protein